MKTLVRTFGFKKGQPMDIEIMDLSLVKQRPHSFKGPFKASFYQIIWLTESEATFEIDFQSIRIKAGELFLISVNQVYSFDVDIAYSGKMILFTDSFYNQTEFDTHFLKRSEILNPAASKKAIRLEPGLMGKIMELLTHELIKPYDILMPIIAQSYLKTILMEMERKITAGNTILSHRGDMSIGRRFCDEVELHFKKKRNTEFYLKLMAIGEKALSREVKAFTGKTPKRYIDSRIILEAKRHLAYGDSTVKEISIELGFDEATNFNKFFKKHTKTTPILFRQSSQK